MAYLRGYHPNTPKFLIGHSIGALYAARLCQKEPDFFKGQILINPLMEFKDKISAFKKARLTATKMMQYTERSPYPAMDDFLPDELRVIKENNEDFYIESKTTVESYLELLKLQEEVLEERDYLHAPTLMITAEDDNMANTAASKEFFDSLQSVRHKKYIEIPKADHFMINWEHQYEQL